MNLTLFFRLISMSIGMGSKNFSTQDKTTESFYRNTYFYCPRVVAKDGFSISLQINNGNYCKSENGYRELGHSWEEVEFGFPSEHDDLLVEYSQNKKDVTNSVGMIPVSVLEVLFEKRGGVDWDKTISIEHYNKLLDK